MKFDPHVTFNKCFQLYQLVKTDIIYELVGIELNKAHFSRNSTDRNLMRRHCSNSNTRDHNSEQDGDGCML